MFRVAAAIVIAVVTLTAGAAPAEEWQTKEGDRLLDRDELETILRGHEVEFHDGSRASYGADGSYGYLYAGDDSAHAGRFETGEDSAVCVTFENGAARCDLYVMNGARLILITESGLRFPVRALR